jgi:hypothetical protein
MALPFTLLQTLQKQSREKFRIVWAIVADNQQ